MARPSRQEPPDGDPTVLNSLADIIGEHLEAMGQVEVDILAARAGAVSGTPMSLAEIGEWLMGVIGYPITKQRVSFLLRRALKRLPPATMALLVRTYPLIGGANIKHVDSKLKRRKAVVSLRRGVPHWQGRVQYAKILGRFGIEIPEHRRETAEDMDELDSVKAIGADFNVVRIGRFRICASCHEPKLIEDMFKTKSGLPYARCRECNRSITREFYAKKAAEAEPVAETT